MSNFKEPLPKNDGASFSVRQFWQKLRVFWRGKPENEALLEAVEEIIAPTSEGASTPSPERALLANIVRLHTKEVGDCMIPRADIHAISVDSPSNELIELFTKCLHSRIPVFRDTLDEVIGMVHAKDVLLRLAKGQECVIKDMLRPVLIVVPSMPVSKLLRQMRHARQHLAIVVDEFGGVDGLVTIEDLVEEVVGEIEDEHEHASEPEIVARADGTLIIDARLPIELFESRIKTVLLSEEERDEIDTLGGYVFHLAGHVPKIGEILRDSHNWEYEVLEATHNHIRRLRLRHKKV